MHVVKPNIKEGRRRVGSSNAFIFSLLQCPSQRVLAHPPTYAASFLTEESEKPFRTKCNSWPCPLEWGEWGGGCLVRVITRPKIWISLWKYLKLHLGDACCQHLLKPPRDSRGARLNRAFALRSQNGAFPLKHRSCLDSSGIRKLHIMNLLPEYIIQTDYSGILSIFPFRILNISDFVPAFDGGGVCPPGSEGGAISLAARGGSRFSIVFRSGKSIFPSASPVFYQHFHFPNLGDPW